MGRCEREYRGKMYPDHAWSSRPDGVVCIQCGKVEKTPKLRLQCQEQSSKVCPVLRCRYHLVADHPRTRRLLRKIAAALDEGKRVTADVLIDELVEELAPRDIPARVRRSWCVLDQAERGGMTLEQIGRLVDVTRERARQIEKAGLDAIGDGYHPEYAEAVANG